MSTNEDDRKMKPKLLALPAELRNQIWEHAITSRDKLHIVYLLKSTDIRPALLRACKQIRREASAIHYARNTFRLDNVSAATWRTKHVALRDWVRRIGPRARSQLRRIEVSLQRPADVTERLNLESFLTDQQNHEHKMTSFYLFSIGRLGVKHSSYYVCCPDDVCIDTMRVTKTARKIIESGQGFSDFVHRLMPRMPLLLAVAAKLLLIFVGAAILILW